MSELADWFSSYVYLPNIQDRVVLETAIRDAVGMLDAAFAYANDVDTGSGRYLGLALAHTGPDIFPATAVVVRADVAGVQIADTPKPSATGLGGTSTSSPAPTSNGGEPAAGKLAGPRKPKRFYGTVELDMVRPVKAFDAVLSAVVMELQRAKGAKVKITVEIEAEAPEGFDDGDVRAAPYLNESFWDSQISEKMIHTVCRVWRPAVMSKALSLDLRVRVLA
ncbi:MAG: hypothetical protein ACKOED_03010, partial [Aestuariivirga sp.]